MIIPETIGSIAYLSKNLSTMKKNIIAGFNITCIGDDRQYSIILSRKENTISDKVAQNVLNKIAKNYKIYSFGEKEVAMKGNIVLRMLIFLYVH